MCKFSGMQVHARTSSSPEFLHMVTKPDAAVEENFHENKHMQESNDLEMQRSDFVLPCICVALGRAFESRQLLLARAFWRKDFSWIYTCDLSLSAGLHNVFSSPVKPEVQLCIYFACKDGNSEQNISSPACVRKKYLVQPTQKRAVTFYISPRSRATCVASIINYIFSRRYLVTESQGIIKQYLCMLCSGFYKYIDIKI